MIQETAKPDSSIALVQEMPERTGRFREIYEDFVASKIAVLGFVLVTVAGLTAIFAPLIAPYDPTTPLSMPLQSSSPEHILGTDHLGRDVFSRIVFGARVSLIVGISAQSLSVIVGLTLGLIAGYYGGRVDGFIMSVVDIFMSFPYILLALLIVASLGAGIGNVILALGVTGWTAIARIARIQALSLREENYIQAQKSIGCSNGYILLRHVFPNALAPVLVVATLGMAFAIIGEASLSFLGVGVPPPTPSWGKMLADGRAYMSPAPQLSIFSGLGILLTVLGFNLLGDGLRDALDPRLRTRALG